MEYPTPGEIRNAITALRRVRDSASSDCTIYRRIDRSAYARVEGSLESIEDYLTVQPTIRNLMTPMDKEGGL